MSQTEIIKTVLYTAIGYITSLLGGYDVALKTVLFLTIVDFITGILQAIRNKDFSARKCADGIIRKIFIYITVAMAVCVQNFMGNSIPLREIVIIFYIVSEGMSCLENIGKVIKYPKQLKEIFVQLKEKNEQN